MSNKVSIILLSYNQADYIEEALKSVFEQTHENWELVISDNGSNDGTDQILKNYADDERVKLLLYDSNEFVTKRSNQALNEASGDLISILYGDDYYLPSKIEEQVNCFKNLSQDWGVVHGPGYNLDQFTQTQSIEKVLKAHGDALKDILMYYFVKGFINPISPLVRRECFKKYPFYEDLFTEGESIYMRFSLSYKFFYMDEPLVVMREHDKNARWFSKRNIEIQDKCLERLGDYKEFPEDCIDELSKLRSQTYNIGAWENIRLSKSMDVSYIRSRIHKAFKQDPLKTISLKNFLVLVLTLSPDFVRKIFNTFLNYLTKKEKSIYFDDSFIK